MLTGQRRTAYYRSGFRSGCGEAVAVAFPGTLVEMWRTLQVCVDHACAIIVQATKTGLTEGSCPSGNDYGRPVVIINVKRLRGLKLLDQGKQVLAFPGTSLYEVTKQLQPLGREPHSVIGSTTIGATVIGGIANNAGGALCKRGSSYTELAMYAKVDQAGNLVLVDELGIEGLGDSPEEKLRRLEAGDFQEGDVKRWDATASDRGYASRIRDIDATVPNRYNADPSRLYGVSGSAGKVAAFAVRVDTYPAPARKSVFYIGTNNPAHWVKLRRDVLQNFEHLPEMVEYMDRGMFDAATKFGKDVFLSIKHLGTERLPKAYALKASVEGILNRVPCLPKFIPDLMLYYASNCWPNHLPKRLCEFRDRFEHYLIFVAADECIQETESYLESLRRECSDVDSFCCTEDEQQAALLHRFSAAGAGIRFQNVHQRITEEVLALDVALLGRDEAWIEPPPPEVQEHLVIGLTYGHFLCHVFHMDYIFKTGTDVNAMKKILLSRLDERGAKYPAEHNVGHLYQAGPEQRKHFESLDPTNTFNPGIGGTSKLAHR
ncbi:MAG: D-lactate dehydrogenase [Planctomycetota bacterium]